MRSSEEPFGRKRFDHLVVEVSVAVNTPIPRYALWLRLRESGADPERLSRRDAIAFCDGALDDFLADRGCRLPPRARRRLRRSVARFDPTTPSPDERIARL